jgi:hypothetical protein
MKSEFLRIFDQISSFHFTNNLKEPFSARVFFGFVIFIKFFLTFLANFQNSDEIPSLLRLVLLLYSKNSEFLRVPNRTLPVLYRTVPYRTIPWYVRFGSVRYAKKLAVFTVHRFFLYSFGCFPNK